MSSLQVVLKDSDLVFAEDLVQFVMSGYDLTGGTKGAGERRGTGGGVTIRFVPCVGHVIRYLASLQEDKTLVAFDYLRCTILSGEHFEEFAAGMVEAHFTGEFQMVDFLSFCSQITRLSVLFFNNNVPAAPDKTALVIRHVLQAERLRFLSVGGWDRLYDVCFYILHRIPRKQRNKVPSKAPTPLMA